MPAPVFVRPPAFAVPPVMTPVNSPAFVMFTVMPPVAEKVLAPELAMEVPEAVEVAVRVVVPPELMVVPFEIATAVPPSEAVPVMLTLPVLFAVIFGPPAGPMLTAVPDVVSSRPVMLILAPLLAVIE